MPALLNLSTRLRAAIRNSEVWKRRAARRLAGSTKRLDLCAAQIAHLLHLARPSLLEGKVCLELGSGWVLTHALVLHVLGAKTVIASDVSRQANPAAARLAVQIASASMVRDLLSPFADHDALRERVDRLRAWTDYSFEGLERLGVHYVAPIDFTGRQLGFPVDFVYSNSVLEHVPLANVAALVGNVVSDLAPGGEMIHAIHLEDHRNHNENPFAFHSIPANAYPAAEQTARGNRLRASAWLTHFSSLPGLETRVLYRWARSASLLPAKIDTSVANEGVEDLRTSHLGLFVRKPR